MDNPSKLVDDHLDGELTDDGFRQLGGWLRERDEHVREFATQWLIHSLVHDYMNQRQVQADALLRALTTTRGESRTATLPDALTTSAARARQLPRRKTIARRGGRCSTAWRGSATGLSAWRR